MVHFDCFFYHSHLPCHASLRVRAEANLSCPAYRANATVDEADRPVLQKHSKEVMTEA